MDGFKVVAHAEKAPGKCIASRDIEGPFIDTGNQITERGRVYLSCRWIKEAAEEFCDMIPREEIEARIAAMEAQHAEYKEKLEALAELPETLAEYEASKERVAA